MFWHNQVLIGEPIFVGDVKKTDTLGERMLGHIVGDVGTNIEAATIRQKVAPWSRPGRSALFCSIHHCSLHCQSMGTIKVMRSSQAVLFCDHVDPTKGSSGPPGPKNAQLVQKEPPSSLAPVGTRTVKHLGKKTKKSTVCKLGAL